MSSKLILMNSNGKKLVIDSGSALEDKQIQSSDIAYIRTTIKDMMTIPSPSNNEVCVVTEDGRGGTFIYDSTQASIDDGGTIFNGWKRQYSGAVNVNWFGCTNNNDLKYAFNSNYYNYYIPHTFNYGYSTSDNKTLFTEVELPNRDFIVYDNSIDNGYTGDSHQGGQIRKFLINKDANNGQHNSFEYLYSEHHPGDMYVISGNGLDSSNNLARNATNFYQSKSTGYEWGIGMGGNSTQVANPSNVTKEEELKTSGFKIVASGLYGNLGLTNVMNISLRNGYFGFKTGSEQQVARYDFKLKANPNGEQSGDYLMYLRTDDDTKNANLLIGSKTDYAKINYDITTGGLKLSDKNGEQCIFANNSFIAKNIEYELYLSKGNYTGIRTYNSGSVLGFVTKEGSTKFTIESDKVKINQVAVLMPNIPTSDPKTAGQLYVDSSNNVKISQG